MLKKKKGIYQKSRTELFTSYRSTFHPNIKPLNDDQYQNNSFALFADSINIKFSILQRKIEELKELYIQRNRPTFDNNSLELCDNEIKKTTADISKRISNLKNEIKHPITTQDHEEATLLVNLQQCHSLRLAEYVQFFRTIQAEQNLEVSFNIEEQDTLADIYNDFHPEDPVEKSTLLVQHETEEQNEDLTQIVSMMNELNQMFRDLSLLVFEQGTVLDRIDTRIEIAFEDTKKATKHLEKAVARQTSKGFYIYLIILIIIIIVLILVLIFKKK